MAQKIPMTYDEAMDMVKPPKARPAIPMITPAPAQAGPTGAPPASNPLLGAPPQQPQPNVFPALANSPSFTGNSPNNLPMPGGAPQPFALNPMSTASPQEMAAADPNSGVNVARRSASPNPLISGPEREVAAIGQRQGVVDSANTGGSYANAVSPGGFGLTPQQAVGMGFVPQPSQVTAPNLAYGGAPIGSTQFFGGPRADAAGVPLQPGQRDDESAADFGQRRKDIASMNMQNADIGSRQARARQAKSLLSSQARQVAKSGDTKSAAALFSQAAGMETPSRATPYSVARTREEDATKRTVGKDGDSTKLQISRDTTERERMRQEGLNTRAERKQTFDQTMADNKARLASVSEGNRTRATGLIRQIETIGRQIQKQEEYVGGDTDAAAKSRITALETNREKVQGELDKIFGETTPATNATAPIGTMNGKPVTEADIQTTMKARGLTREQVLAEIAKRGFTSNAR